jgi:hypothetical protein
MKQAVMMDLFNALGLMLLRATQEANLLVTFGPSYVITRFVMGKVVAGAALLLAHFPVHGT